MALRKPLVLSDDGTFQQLQAGDSLDIVHPSTSTSFVVTLAEDASEGDLLAASSQGVVLADKDDDDKVNVLGVAEADGVIGNSINVKPGGLVENLTGISAGAPLFLGSAGAITMSYSSTGNSVRVGFGITSSSMLLEIDQPIKL